MKRSTFFSIFFILFVGCAQIGHPLVESHEYIHSTPESLKTLVVPPPAPGSEAEKKDFAILLDWQKKRTPEICAAATKDADYDNPADLFSPEYGGGITSVQYEALKPFFKNIIKDSRYIVGVLKKDYSRPRPYDANSQIKPCAPREKSKAYPSGHTTNGRLLALVLGELDPKNAKKYLARGNEIGLLRIQGGVHHPSDVLISQKLADQLFIELKKDLKFQSDLKLYQSKKLFN